MTDLGRVVLDPPSLLEAPAVFLLAAALFLHPLAAAVLRKVRGAW